MRYRGVSLSAQVARAPSLCQPSPHITRLELDFPLLYSPRDMAKSALNIGAAVAGAVFFAAALVWATVIHARPPGVFDRSLVLWGIVAVSGGLTLCWSTVVGHLSRIRMWSPPWTLLAGAAPFYILSVWIFFFSTLEMRLLGYARMLLVACFGSISGRLARKKAYPQFSSEDSMSASEPPPSLFPR